MKMTKIVLSTFAFIFALGGAIATNVAAASNAAGVTVATLVNGFTCTITGVCTTTVETGLCTIGGVELLTISSSCQDRAFGRFTPR